MPRAIRPGEAVFAIGRHGTRRSGSSCRAAMRVVSTV